MGNRVMAVDPGLVGGIALLEDEVEGVWFSAASGTKESLSRPRAARDLVLRQLNQRCVVAMKSQRIGRRNHLSASCGDEELEKTAVAIFRRSGCGGPS